MHRCHKSQPASSDCLQPLFRQAQHVAVALAGRLVMAMRPHDLIEPERPMIRVYVDHELIEGAAVIVARIALPV